MNGTVERIGSRYTQEMIILHPFEKRETLENKLMKRCKLDVRECNHQIAEGDVVMMTTFFQPTYEKPFLKDHTSPLAREVNVMAKNAKENQHFINSITEFGNTVEYALIATVKEILPDLKVKLTTQPNAEQSQSFSNRNRVWKITKLAYRYQLDRMDESLMEFCTKSSMNTAL